MKNKKTVMAVVALVALVAIAAVCWFAFGPKGVEGSKTIVVDVTHKDGTTNTYEIHTDAEFLRGAMEQEGLIALFRAIESYRPQAEVSFETYAMRCVRNGISDARLRAGRKKHQPLNHSVPLEDESRAVPGPEEQAVDKEQYRATVRILRTGLTPTERRVLLLRLDGCDYRTIARRLGISSKAVDNALVRVRAKLKNRREL